MAQPTRSGVADLHTHTRHSDGDLNTTELLDYALQHGVTALSITDHDSVAAYIEQAAILKDIQEETALQIIPGIEISTSDADGKYHILGLNIDPRSSVLTVFLQRLNAGRARYTIDVCERLRAGGWHIDAQRLLGLTGTITKAHIAKALLDDSRNAVLCKKWTGIATPTEGQLIEATIVAGKPFYVKKQNEVTPAQAIDVIHQACGVAILAHPSFNLMQGEALTHLCDKFESIGIDGYEAINIQYDRSNNDDVVEHREQFESRSKEKNLLVTGGSDFHSPDPSRLGAFIDIGFANHAWNVPLSIVDEIKEYSRRYK